MAGEDDRVVFAELLDEVPDLDDLHRVEAYGRLVEDDDARVAEYRLGDADTLPVALGKVLDEALAVVLQACEFHYPVNLGGDVCLGYALRLRDELEIFVGGAVEVERRELRQIAYELLGFHVFLEDVVPFYDNIALCCGKAAGHDVHGRRFACAVGPEKSVDAAGLDAEVQIGYGCEISVFLGKVLYFDHLAFLLKEISFFFIAASALTQ